MSFFEMIALLVVTLLFINVAGDDIQLLASHSLDIFKDEQSESILTLKNGPENDLDVNTNSDTVTNAEPKSSTTCCELQGDDMDRFNDSSTKEAAPTVLTRIVLQGNSHINNPKVITGPHKLSKRDVTPSFRFSLPQKSSKQNVNDVCGLRVDTAAYVVEGRPTYVGEFPWLAAMFYYESGNYSFRCGGNLITRSHVLTASHCFKDKARWIESKNIVFAFGKHNISTWLTEALVRGIEKYIPHPDYKKPSDADLAIVKLDAPIDFSTTIRPICLWDEDDSIRLIENETGDVAGWGRDESGQRFVNEPKKVSVPVIEQYFCTLSDSRFLSLVSERTFCAGHKNGSSPCTGDSGGGFIMLRGGRWRLRGLVSAGLVKAHSCDPNHYTVFCDVAKFKEWIIANVDGDL